MSCLIEEPLDRNAAMYLDGRFYFRDNNGIGRTTCDIARTAGAARLRDIQNLTEYLDPAWLNRVELAAGNPSVLGFLVEVIALGNLITYGTPFAGPEFSGSLRLQKFFGANPHFIPRENNVPTIFIPTAFNYEAVDAILAVREEGTFGTKATVVGIQVTIASSHSDSEAGFMGSWAPWHTLMGCDNTEFRFLWIVENIKGKPVDWEQIPQKTITLRSVPKVVTPKYKRRYMSIQNLSHDLGLRLEKARCTK
ncbi:hypothetical protein BDD12DRAFT_865960 [Trichophaea hybrida]|nr:hypothetical protein BDD12DRAFT_865960 [Trichophaea hybrida]